MRLPVAAALVIWGARTDRRWTVLVGATLALPVLWLTGLSMFAGLAIELSERARRTLGPGPATGTDRPVRDVPDPSVPAPPGA